MITPMTTKPQYLPKADSSAPLSFEDVWSTWRGSNLEGTCFAQGGNVALQSRQKESFPDRRAEERALAFPLNSMRAEATEERGELSYPVQLAGRGSGHWSNPCLVCGPVQQ